MDSNNNDELSVKRFDVTVNTSDICEKGVEIVKLVRKEWKDKEVAVKIFTEGLTNRLIGCYLPENENDKVLVRVYGEKTEIMIDRKAELKNMIQLNRCSFGPPVYCVFNNGIVYGFEKGDILNKHLVRRIDIAFKIAEKMAKMHTLNIEKDSKCEALIFVLMRKVLEQLFDRTLNERQLLNDTEVTKQSLTDEVNYVQHMLETSDSPIVFCHNDLLPANILYDGDSKEIKFIDYEYACYNYQAFDIADHFAEYVGIVDFDATLLPSSDFQMTWLREYLQFYRIFTNNPNVVQKSDIDKLYIQVNQFASCVHLLWAIWALVMHQFSSHQFDYFRFASQRLSLYFKYKRNFLTLKK